MNKSVFAIITLIAITAAGKKTIKERTIEKADPIATRDGFIFRLARCEEWKNNSSYICTICYSHPKYWLGQIRVWCDASSCEFITDVNDPRNKNADWSFCKNN